MKINHLFASAAIAVVFVATAPAHAQLLGGGLRGGVSGMQSATFGGGFGPTRGAFNDQGAASASGHAGARTNATDRASKAAKSGANKGMQAGERAKMDAVTAGRRAVDVGATDAATIGGTATASADRATAGAATGVTTAEQSEASAGKLSKEFAGGVSGHDSVGPKPTSSPHAGRTAGQTTPTNPTDGQGTPKRRPATTGEKGSSEPNANGKASAGSGGEMPGTTSDANAYVSMNASATP